MLVIIDGLDGSGKSTQANLLAKAIQLSNKTVCLRIHPESDNWFGMKARVFLHCAGKNAHFASALFYMVDVMRSIVLYSWRKNDFVVFVRYLMGTAYLPYPLNVLGYLFFSSLVPKSDKMIFLDVDPTVAITRIHKYRQEIEMFENLTSLLKTRAKALFLLRFDNWTLVDANETPRSIALVLRNYCLSN